MKYMRDVKQAELRGDSKLPPPPPAMTQHYDDYVQCPYCGRKYNQEVANRHIPKCKDIINKPKPPPSKLNTPNNSKLSSTNYNNYGNNPNYNALSGSKLGGINSSSGYNANPNSQMNYNMSSNMNYMNNNYNNAATPSKMVTPSKNVMAPSPKLISPGVKGISSASGIKRKY